MDTVRSVEVRLISGSLGPGDDAVITITLPDGADGPPLVIEDPTPDRRGAWRRVSAPPDGIAYVRIPRIAAP